MPSRSSSSRRLLLTYMYFAVWCCVGLLTICSLGCNPLPTSTLSLSLSPFLFLLFTGEKKKTKVIDNNLDPEWNEVGSALSCFCSLNLICFPFIFFLLPQSICLIFLPSLSLTHAQTQTLIWNLQVGLSGLEVLKVEVYDHETVGRNRYYIILTLLYILN